MPNYFKKILYLIGEKREKLPKLILMFLGISLLDVIGISLIGPYIALIIDANALDGPFGKFINLLELPNQNRRELLIYISVALVVIFMLKTLSAIWIHREIILFGQNQRVRLRSFLMQAYQSLPYSEYLRRNSAEYIYSIQELTSQFQFNAVVPLFRILVDGFVGLSILILLAWQDLPALILLVTLLGTTIISYNLLFRHKISMYGEKANIASTTMLQGINEGIGGLKEIRILGKEKYFLNMVRSGAEGNAFYSAKAEVLSSTPRFILELVLISFIVLLVVFTILLGDDLKVLASTLGMFGVASIKLLPSANTISTGLVNLRFGRDGVNRLYKEVMSFEQINIREKGEQFDTNDSVFSSLAFKNVSFRYSKSKQNALNQISLEINAGEAIGLIGASGSGKTTLLDVLLGLLERHEGEISFNKKPIESSLAEWRSQVAYLPQDIFIIDNTLKHNVALGLKTEEIDESKIRASLKQARLTELVEQLPLGLDTVLGEHGVRLSGGQRQRVALARAFYYNRSVLVMDEATSALDNETEQEIVNEIQQLKGKKTLIVIAHRLSTLRHCDRIYRLSDGKIVETGTYNSVVNNLNSSNTLIT